ncbi:uncharacterized protein CIMG_13055 [Coccidioides immitis RS]|uniref:Uncharacterized protein n=1 Tax=Coccidioides immitis (strain RS) TaxID=246410 RepID=A0A0D8JT89_COCIM|nr:uncharacterized protein CIMG_13055 [Coccidioides immitis RS]KJF60570.1 hypothetical protein CIMG_13055 [Coccidioides immitis RS]
MRFNFKKRIFFSFRLSFLFFFFFFFPAVLWSTNREQSLILKLPQPPCQGFPICVVISPSHNSPECCIKRPKPCEVLRLDSRANRKQTQPSPPSPLVRGRLGPKAELTRLDKEVLAIDPCAR